MGAFEYLLLFAAVILGLAVTDLAISLHKVLSAGNRVRWDLLAPLAGLVAFLKIVTQWWTWHAADRLAQGLTFEMFIGLLVGAVLLFLLAASALPDEIGKDERVDLGAHYRSVSQRYWTLFLLHWLLMNGVSVWAQMQLEGAAEPLVPRLRGRSPRPVADPDQGKTLARPVPSWPCRPLPVSVLRADPALAARKSLTFRRVSRIEPPFRRNAIAPSTVTTPADLWRDEDGEAPRRRDRPRGSIAFGPH